jgi:A/G-specific adenine glycosylase
MCPRPSDVPPATLRRRLLAWYRRNARDLPWRRTRDPWRIWVSEVMLQQTRVETALPYYATFLERFPTPAALARAGEPEVLRVWSGLGYYRRARHLQAAARIVTRDHGGRVPGEPRAFAALPGVGRYTAGAVLSIAFDRRRAVLDGNVARVLSRLFAEPASVRDPRGADRLWALADQMLPMRGAAEWNQAIMELGARVCVPRSPRCDVCPIAAGCRARALGRIEEFPPATKRPRSRIVRRAVALIERDGRMLVVRRQGQLLAGMWEPPGIEITNGVAAGPALARAIARLGVRATLTASGERVDHVITHRRIEVEVWRATPRRLPRAAGVRPVDPARPSVPLTALARKLAALRRTV